MPVYELRDSSDARRYLLQSLWLSRAVAPSAATLPATLEWSMEIASENYPLPLVGFVADAGHLALGSLHEPADQSALEIPGIEATLVRKYEDYVLGKLYADPSFERGADAVLRYQGRDRARAAAFLINQLRERAGFGGAILVPAVIKNLQQQAGQAAADILAEGWQSIEREGLAPPLVEDFAELTAAIRNTGDLLGPADIFELEHGTALAQFGQRLALRQVVQAAAELNQRLPREKVRPRVRRQQVATHIADEDLYPIGGYTSISTKGSVESLLHSQLSYMERDARPDLFDVKFLRDELYYYSRDENQFLRRRQTFVFALFPDLVQARFKDAALPWQRIILVLAALTAAVEKLIEWLSDDALTFEILFIESAGASPLSDERTLLETLLREQIANGTVVIETLPPDELPRRCDDRSRRSLCHCLAVSARLHEVPAETAQVMRLRIEGPQPEFATADERPASPAEVGLDGWAEMLHGLLREWIG